MHYSSTTNAILLLTLNLCVYFIYFIAVNTLGGNFFLFAEIGPTICCRLPDEASFLEIGGVYHPSIPPREFRPCLI